MRLGRFFYHWRQGLLLRLGPTVERFPLDRALSGKRLVRGGPTQTAFALKEVLGWQIANVDIL